MCVYTKTAILFNLGESWLWEYLATIHLDFKEIIAKYPEFQSSYRQNNSTETALVKAGNAILMKMNSKEMTLFVILDLSVAFDTVNHNILLTRLNEEIGIC